MISPKVGCTIEFCIGGVTKGKGTLQRIWVDCMKKKVYQVMQPNKSAADQIFENEIIKFY